MKRSLQSPSEQLQQTYLDALVRALWSMPKAKREDVTRELASHIKMLVAEELCANASAREATQAALRQFGRPAVVGRRIAWQWHKEYGMKTPRFVGAMGIIATLLSSAWLLMMGAALSRTFFPSGKLLIVGSEGAKMSVQNGVVQVASGQAGVIGINPLLLTMAVAIPFLIVLLVALVGCVSLVRRPVGI